MAHIFDDFPIAGEAVEYQGRGIAADAGTPILHSYKELRHAVIRRFLSGLGNSRASNQRKAHGIISLEYQQRVRLIVGEPVGENLRFVRIVRADDREQTGVQISEGFDVLAVDTLDPLAILFRMSDIANADKQRNFILDLEKDTARANLPDGSPPGLVGSASSEAYYGFAADAALAAASAAALAAAAESAAAEAAASAAGAAAGGAAAGAGASVLLPQALSMNAATKAVRASLVFIYRYPRKFKGKKFRPSVLFLGLYPNVPADFRVFWRNFISLSPTTLPL